MSKQIISMSPQEKVDLFLDNQVKPLERILKKGECSATTLMGVLGNLQLSIIDMTDYKQNKNTIDLFTERLAELPESPEKTAIAVAFLDIGKQITELRKLSQTRETEESKTSMEVVKGQNAKAKRSADALVATSSIIVSAGTTYIIKSSINEIFNSVTGGIAGAIGSPFGYCVQEMTEFKQPTAFQRLMGGGITTETTSVRTDNLICNALGYISNGVVGMNNVIVKGSNTAFIVFALVLAILLFLLFKLMTGKFKVGLTGVKYEFKPKTKKSKKSLKPKKSKKSLDVKKNKK